MCCWRPHFEGLSQLWSPSLSAIKVVEDPILRGYHNSRWEQRKEHTVVEAPILRGYHNNVTRRTISPTVVEAPILRGYHNSCPENMTALSVVEDPILRGYYNIALGRLEAESVVEDPIWMVITTQKKEKSTITGVRKWFLDKGTIKNKKSIVNIKKSI